MTTTPAPLPVRTDAERDAYRTAMRAVYTEEVAPTAPYTIVPIEGPDGHTVYTVSGHMHPTRGAAQAYIDRLQELDREHAILTAQARALGIED